MTEISGGQAIDSITYEQSYAQYERLMAAINLKSPQAQGLDLEGFINASADPRVMKSEIVEEGDRFLMPQLCPVESYSWLNVDHYSGQFPEEHQNGTLLHFTEIEGVEPSAEVRGKLQEMAGNNGVLVFDYPMDDGEYTERLDSLLQELGIQRSEIQELGTQTYYAGQLVLKRTHQSRDEPISLSDTYEMLGDGNPESDGVKLVRSVDPEMAQELYRLYEDAFQVINNHPCKQGLSPDEFMDMICNDTEVSKLIYIRDGVPESLCILGEDLSKFDWVNPDYYERLFPDKFAKKQVVYFPAIATDPSRKGITNSKSILEFMARLAENGDNAFVGAFDCCDMNAGSLNKFFERFINGAPETEISLDPIAVQRYCAIRLKK